MKSENNISITLQRPEYIRAGKQMERLQRSWNTVGKLFDVFKSKLDETNGSTALSYARSALNDVSVALENEIAEGEKEKIIRENSFLIICILWKK